jgi:Holliday junction resolvase RusA-like endonuclease
MPTVTFVAPIIRGKGRPRFARGHAYTPKATRDAERIVAGCFARAVGGGWEPIAGPLAVVVRTRKRLPRSTPRRVESIADVTKPDADNVAKLVMDALNGIAYLDDSQVTSLTVVKMPRTRECDGTTEVTLAWGDDHAKP